jgi:transposase
MANRYRITLTQEERTSLLASTRSGKTNAPKYIHARALLLCDQGPHSEGVWTVACVAAALGVSSRTIEHLKARFVEQGLAAALERKPSSKPRDITFAGDFDARVMALACSPAPEGFARWTVRLLAEQIIELKIAPAVSIMTVQRSLKKTNCSLIAANIGKSRRMPMRHS